MWVGRFAAAFAVWAVVTAVAYSRGNQPRPGSARAVRRGRCGHALAVPRRVSPAWPTRWTTRRARALPAAGTGPRLALLTPGRGQHLDAKEVGDGLHRHLRALADQRLVARYGVSAVADPERAAELIGPRAGRVSSPARSRTPG